MRREPEARTPAIAARCTTESKRWVSKSLRSAARSRRSPSWSVKSAPGHAFHDLASVLALASGIIIVVEVVEADHAVAAPEQRGRGVAPDETGRSGQKTVRADKGCHAIPKPARQQPSALGRGFRQALGVDTARLDEVLDDLVAPGHEPLGDPDATTSPFASRKMQSAIRKAPAISCEITMLVTPKRSRVSRIRSSTRRLVIGSRPLSSVRRRGWLAARA